MTTATAVINKKSMTAKQAEKAWPSPKDLKEDKKLSERDRLQVLLLMHHGDGNKVPAHYKFAVGSATREVAGRDISDLSDEEVSGILEFCFDGPDSLLDQ